MSIPAFDKQGFPIHPTQRDERAAKTYASSINSKSVSDKSHKTATNALTVGANGEYSAILERNPKALPKERVSYPNTFGNSKID